MVRKLDRELEPVSFVSGGIEWSFLDLYIFAGLYEAGYYKLTREEYNAAPNITRWYGHMQHLLRGYSPALEQLIIDPTPLPKSEKKEKSAEKKRKEAGGQKKSKKEKEAGGQKSKKEKKAAAAPAEAAAAADLFGLLDLRVGKVVEVELHPDSDKLFVEK